jgi:anti-anti-sigma factor
MDTVFQFKGEMRAEGLIVRWHLEDDVVTAALVGDLRIGQAVGVFEQLVGTVDQQGKGMLLDLGGLGRVDSRGLGCLVAAAQLLGNRIRLVNLAERTVPLLAVCKLLTVLPITASPREALAELRRELDARRCLS